MSRSRLAVAFALWLTQPCAAQLGGSSHPDAELRSGRRDDQQSRGGPVPPLPEIPAEFYRLPPSIRAKAIELYEISGMDETAFIVDAALGERVQRLGDELLAELQKSQAPRDAASKKEFDVLLELWSGERDQFTMGGRMLDKALGTVLNQFVLVTNNDIAALERQAEEERSRDRQPGPGAGEDERGGGAGRDDGAGAERPGGGEQEAPGGGGNQRRTTRRRTNPSPPPPPRAPGDRRPLHERLAGTPWLASQPKMFVPAGLVGSKINAAKADAALSGAKGDSKILNVDRGDGGGVEPAKDAKPLGTLKPAGAGFIAAGVVGAVGGAALFSPQNANQVVAAAGAGIGSSIVALEEAGLKVEGGQIKNARTGRAATDGEIRSLIGAIAKLPLAANDPGFEPAVFQELEKLFPAAKAAGDEKTKDVELDETQGFVFTKDCDAVARELCNKLFKELYKRGQRLSPEQQKSLLAALKASAGETPGHRDRVSRARAAWRLPKSAARPRLDAAAHAAALKSLETLRTLGAGLGRPEENKAGNTHFADTRASAVDQGLRGAAIALPGAARELLLADGAAEAESWRKAIGAWFWAKEQDRPVPEVELARVERELAEFVAAAADSLARALEDWQAEKLGSDPNAEEAAREKTAKALLGLKPEARRALADKLAALQAKLGSAKPEESARLLNELFDKLRGSIAEDPALGGSPEVAGYLRLKQDQFQRAFASGQLELAVNSLVAMGLGTELPPPPPDQPNKLQLAIAQAILALPFEGLAQASGAARWARDTIGAEEAVEYRRLRRERAETTLTLLEAILAADADRLLDLSLYDGSSPGKFIRELLAEGREALKGLDAPGGLSKLLEWQRDADGYLSGNKLTVLGQESDALDRLQKALAKLGEAGKALEHGAASAFGDKHSRALELLRSLSDDTELSDEDGAIVAAFFAELQGSQDQSLRHLLEAYEQASKAYEAAAADLSEFHEKNPQIADYRGAKLQMRQFSLAWIETGRPPVGIAWNGDELGLELGWGGTLTVHEDAGKRGGQIVRKSPASVEFQSFDGSLHWVSDGKKKVIHSFDENRLPIEELTLDLATGLPVRRVAYAKDGSRTIWDAERKENLRIRPSPDGGELIDDLDKKISYRVALVDGQVKVSTPTLTGTPHEVFMDQGGRIVEIRLKLEKGEGLDLAALKRLGVPGLSWHDYQIGELEDLVERHFKWGLGGINDTRIVLPPDGPPQVMIQWKPSSMAFATTESFFYDRQGFPNRLSSYPSGNDRIERLERWHGFVKDKGQYRAGENWGSVEVFDTTWVRRYDVDRDEWGLKTAIASTRFTWEPDGHGGWKWGAGKVSAPADDTMWSWASKRIAWTFENVGGFKHVGETLNWLAERGTDFGHLISGATGELVGHAGSQDHMIYGIVTYWSAPGMGGKPLDYCKSLLEKPGHTEEGQGCLNKRRDAISAMMRELREKLGEKAFNERMGSWKELYRQWLAEQQLESGSVFAVAGAKDLANKDISEETIGDFLLMGEGEEGLDGSIKAFNRKASESDNALDKAFNTMMMVNVHGFKFLEQSLAFEGLGQFSGFVGKLAKAKNATYLIKVPNALVQSANFVKSAYFMSTMGQQIAAFGDAFASGDEKKQRDALAQIVALGLMPSGGNKNKAQIAKDAAAKSATPRKTYLKTYLKEFAKELTTTNMLARNLKRGKDFVQGLRERGPRGGLGALGYNPFMKGGKLYAGQKQAIAEAAEEVSGRDPKLAKELGELALKPESADAKTLIDLATRLRASNPKKDSKAAELAEGLENAALAKLVEELAKDKKQEPVQDKREQAGAEKKRAPLEEKDWNRLASENESISELERKAARLEKEAHPDRVEAAKKGIDKSRMSDADKTAEKLKKEKQAAEKLAEAKRLREQASAKREAIRKELEAQREAVGIELLENLGKPEKGGQDELVDTDVALGAAELLAGSGDPRRVGQAEAFLRLLKAHGKVRLGGGMGRFEFEKRFNELAEKNPKARAILDKLLESLIFYEGSLPNTDPRYTDAAGVLRELKIGETADHNPAGGAKYQDRVMLARAIAEGKTLTTSDHGMHAALDALAGKGPRNFDLLADGKPYGKASLTVTRLPDGRLELTIDGPGGRSTGRVRRAPKGSKDLPAPGEREPFGPTDLGPKAPRTSSVAELAALVEKARAVYEAYKAAGREGEFDLRAVYKLYSEGYKAEPEAPEIVRERLTKLREMIIASPHRFGKLSQGQGWFWLRNGEVEGEGGRFYVNAKNPDAALALVKLIAEKMVEAGHTDFILKTREGAKQTELAPDNIVFFVPRGRMAAVYEQILAKLDPALLREGGPPMTRKLGAGISWGDEPKGGGASFGSLRAQAIAEVLKRTPPDALNDPAKLLELVKKQLSAYGVDGERPWLNEGARDPFEAAAFSRMQTRIRKALTELGPKKSSDPPLPPQEVLDAKLAFMKRFLEVVARRDPALKHVVAALKLTRVRFEKTRGEVGDAFGHYNPETGEVVLSLRYAEVPSTLLAATLAHELQHRYDFLKEAGGKTVELEYRGHMAGADFHRLAKSLLAQKGLDWELVPDGADFEILNPRSNEGYAAWRDYQRHVKRITELSKEPAKLLEYIRKVYPDNEELGPEITKWLKVIEQNQKKLADPEAAVREHNERYPHLRFTAEEIVAGAEESLGKARETLSLLIARARRQLALGRRRPLQDARAPDEALELPDDLAASAKDWAAQAKLKLARVKRFIAKGGGGNVYEAMLDGLEAAVALKVLRGDPKGAKSPAELAAEFRAESARFDALHEACRELGLELAVPEMLGLVDAGGNPAYAMSLVKGLKPADAIAKGLFTEKTLARLREIVDAMASSGKFFEDIGANFLILAEPQTIRGKRYEPGSIVLVDPAGFATAPDLFAANRAKMTAHGFNERDFANREPDRLNRRGKDNHRETWEDLWLDKSEQDMRDNAAVVASELEKLLKSRNP